MSETPQRKETSEQQHPEFWSRTNKMMCATVIGSVVCIIVAALLQFFKHPKACNITTVSNRDFKHYYGLANVENPLSHYNAEQSENINSKCYLFYDHMQLLPSDNRPSLKSMIIQALPGSGKTQIRQCIISKLSQHNNILIKIYGMKINNYLDNFVNNIDITSEPAYEKIRKYWRKEHFLQVILTEMVSCFINEKYLPLLKQKRSTIPLDTRKKIAILLSFYSTKHSTTLCEMINTLLHELTQCTLFSCRIPCNIDQSNNRDIEMLISLTEKHRKIKVKRQTVDTDASLRLLLAVHTKIKSSPLPYLDRSYRDQIASLISFFTTLDISITMIVDSLDESNFFFDENDPNLQTLQTFVDSMTNDDVMYLALGNLGEGIKSTNSFSLLILIPRRPNVLIKISWSRPDKIPIIELKWDELQLINYVDYVFDYLRKQSHHQCKPLPNICSLLGGQQLCSDTMKQLRHPRDFHIFFNVLIQRMNSVCAQRNPPFNATKTDLDIVMKETKLRILDEKTVSL